MKKLKRFLKFLVPSPLRCGGILRSVFEINRHILCDYGWWKSARTRSCRRADGTPVPWFTYPAIDYLDGLDFSSKRIFEWGSGYSTMYWSTRAKEVVSIETDHLWADMVSKQLPSTAKVILTSNDVASYCAIIGKFGTFDAIVIDGTGESRLGASKAACQHLAVNGLIILDNSDLWPQCAEFLRNQDLIQVDFTGFTPIGTDASCTSIFLTREFRFPSKEGIQPHCSVAQPNKPWKDLYCE